MAEAKPFLPVKLICGIISSKEGFMAEAEKRLVALFGAVDSSSPAFAFELTSYYETQMGPGLQRKFLSFSDLVPPESLADIKVQTNRLEDEIRAALKQDFRVVNLDPGTITATALIMATTKAFAHRVPLKQGIYAHLEFLFSKRDINFLDWTYPDFKNPEYQRFFAEVRRRYLEQLRQPYRP